MGALRMHDHDAADDQWLPLAGVPWFVTISGRDDLIVSLQNIIVNTGLARGASRSLASYRRKKWTITVMLNRARSCTS